MGLTRKLGVAEGCNLKRGWELLGLMILWIVRVDE